MEASYLLSTIYSNNANAWFQSHYLIFCWKKKCATLNSHVPDAALKISNHESFQSKLINCAWLIMKQWIKFRSAQNIQCTFRHVHFYNLLIFGHSFVFEFLCWIWWRYHKKLHVLCQRNVLGTLFKSTDK